MLNKVSISAGVGSFYFFMGHLRIRNQGLGSYGTKMGKILALCSH